MSRIECEDCSLIGNFEEIDEVASNNGYALSVCPYCGSGEILVEENIIDE